jgi:hypothetical protein
MNNQINRIYVPTLKWRQGEMKALQVLAPSVKAYVMPLIEIPPIPWDYVEEKPQKPLEEHLQQMPAQIRKNVSDLPCYIDFGLLDAGDRMASGEHPVTAFFQLSSGLPLIPVTGLERDITYQDSVKAVNVAIKSGVCLRVGLEELFNEAFDARAQSLLSILSVVAEETDLVVDLQGVDQGQSAVLRTALPLAWQSQKLTNWRSVILLGTGFPVDLSEVSPGLGSITRTEWLLWRSLSTKIQRQPRFGDYGIAHFDVRELDPRVMKVSASIRYTSDTEWLIFRGRSLRDPRFGGYEQFRTLSTQIVNHPAYAGMEYSWGDRFIYTCAYGEEGTGSLTTWRQVGTNHHITHVVRQLSSSALT